MALAYDIHQHLWPDALLRALAERREPPQLLRGREGWRLRLRGEPDTPVDLADHDPDLRAALAEADRLGPVLETLERRDAPLLVHPGPIAAAAPEGAPRWWGALTDYVSSMHAAWHAFAVWGRPAHPWLRVCFAMLAGLAPLHRERLLARGGRLPLDPGVFLDVSSYGERAVDMMVREIGVDRLVLGSDRPVVEARSLALGDAVDAALR